MGTHKRMRCSLAGQEGTREDFLEEAGIPGGLEPQRGVWKVPLAGAQLGQSVATRMYR